MAGKQIFKPFGRLLFASLSHSVKPGVTSQLCSILRTQTASSLLVNRYSSRGFRIQDGAFHTTSVPRNEHVFNIQDEADFTQRVTKNSKPVVVDFHATWCGPCKLLGPRLESLIAGKKGKVVLAKIDIDEMSDLAVRHGVEAVPTVIAMKGGKVIDKFVGLKDDVDLETFVEKLL